MYICLYIFSSLSLSIYILFIYNIYTYIYMSPKFPYYKHFVKIASQAPSFSSVFAFFQEIAVSGSTFGMVNYLWKIVICVHILEN